MNFTPYGKVMFQDIYEMYYHLFTEIGLGINSDQYLYDQDNGTVLRYKDKYLKATVQPVEIYAGKTDMIFDPAKNYNLIVSILGYYLDKEANNPEGDNIGFIAQYIEDDGTKEKQRVVVKTRKGDYVSTFYHNIYLAYIEVIFLLADNFIVDLSNFDIVF